MADLLVQNASEKLATAVKDASTNVPWATILGSELSVFLKAHIETFAAAGPYTPAAGGALLLCDLSDPNKVSDCECAYMGSGTSCTTEWSTNNVWTNGSVLGAGAAVSVTKATNRTLLIGQSTQLSRAYTADNSAFDTDFYYAMLGLQDDFTTDNNTAVLQNWYNISPGGGAAEKQGKRLSETNYVKVCASGTDWVCGVGASCTWTVPAGATKAKFQAWGAGKGSNPGCCCGGAPYANNGAYSEIVINVTPADTYTVCAGCSCQRWCCSNTNPGEGCMSGVVGNGICCFKADGSYCTNASCASLNSARQTVGLGGACRRFQQLWCTDAGPCWCGEGYFCFASSCGTCGMVPTTPDCCNSNGCSCATTAAKVADGEGRIVRGLTGGGCFDTNNYGSQRRPPIIDADTGAEFSCATGCYNATFSSNCCCGGCNGTAWNWHPGHGGAYTHVMSSNNTHKGDTGRGGMVQISWT